MASMNNEDDGNISILDKMVRELISPEVDEDIPRQERAENSNTECPKSHQDAYENVEFNLKAVLTMHEDEFMHPEHEFYDPATRYSVFPKYDGPQVEVLFSREDIDNNFENKQLPNASLPASCKSTEKDSQLADPEARISPSDRVFHVSSLTQNANYKTVMEETMFIKCCSKEILQLIENIKNTVEQHTGIKNDASFIHVFTVQAWIWIFKETALISSLATKDDKARSKYMNSFLSKIFSIIDDSFKQLCTEMKSLLKAYEKVEHEFKQLNEKSRTRFENNVGGAKEYERNTSGCSFFYHHNQDESKDSSSIDFGITSTKSTQQHNNSSPPASETSRGMKVRWNVDGITVRSSQTGCKWLKFQSVTQDKDKMILMKVFANAVCKTYLDVKKSKMIVRKILQRSNNSLEQIFSKGSITPSSIMESIFKCRAILDKSHKSLKLLPKEEVIMLYSLKSAMAAFSIVKPTLIDVIRATEELQKLTSDFNSQRKKLQSGDIGSRIPLERHAYFEMEIEDTKINIDIMLSRYPNIYDAKSMRDKLLQKSQSHQTTEDGISEDAFIGEVPIETLYSNPVDTFATQSSQELVDTVRSSITDLQCNPISPACYLFNDLGLEYKKSIESLTTTREVSPYMLSLCSDRVRNFHVLAKELAASNDLVQRNIGYAIRNLNCTDSENFGQIENSFWFQIIYKSVQVWDFHSLPKHLKTHFRSVNEKSMEWIEKLEKTFGQFAQQVNGFKEEFLEYHDTLEINQGVRTCIWRKPNRNRLSEYGLKQEGDELCSTTSFQSASSSQPIFLNFTDFDMDLIQVNPDESRTILLSFNKSSSNIQIALVAILFSHIDEVCSRALVNLNSALKIHERQLQLKGLKQLIPTDKRLSTFRQLHQLENLVLAVTVEVIHEKLRETIDCIGKVDNAISQFNRLFQMVQLQLEDRGIIDTTVKKSSTRRRSKRELQMKKEHQDHDFYLNETIQLLRHSVDAMPNSFEIRDESHKNAYLQWVKLAEKDTRLVETFNNNPHISGSESAINSSELKDGMDSKIGAFAESSQIDLDETLPIDFEEAMMFTTTGKAFFPDPVLFTSNIEGWRNMCFKMLAAALNKFRQMIMTKIVRSKIALTCPILSKHHTESESELSSFSKGDRLSVSVPSTENASTTTSSHKVGCAEGLCSIISFITLQLNRRDRVFVTSEDLKQLKSKYYAVTNLVDKFKKDLDSVENSLINSLSLTMASVEYKNLPHDLEIPLNDDDFLKSHDLEEIGSKEEQLAFITQEELPSSEKEEDDDGDDTEQDFVEIFWSTSNKKKLWCRESSASSWLNFSQLHINAQLRLIHIMIDELIQQFQKARTHVKESKADLLCAKKLLEKTWQGIGKDLKRRRIPDSGILVLVKLYRHQIATAVMNTKTIRKITREVRYLLSQSVHNTRIWADELSQGQSVGRNRVMNLDNLTLTVKLKSQVAPERWLVEDEEKVSQNEVKEVSHPISKVRFEDENVTEIKKAVQIKSSTSVDIPKDIINGLSELGMTVWRDPTTRLTLFDKSAPLVKATDFFTTVSDIQRLILAGLDQSFVILKMPNCSNSEYDSKTIPNITGLLTATADVTMNMRQIKEIPPLVRTIITDRLNGLERKINKVEGPDGLADAILSRVEKMKKEVETEDIKFRRKYCANEEFPKMEDIRVLAPEPVYGITPMEFIEDLAARTSSHVWTLMTGIPNIGIVIKDNKTLESHSLSEISLKCQLEVLFSLSNFIEKLVEHVISNLETTQKGIIDAKNKLNSHAKMWTGLRRIKWPMSTAVQMSRWETEDYLHGFASISQICKKAEELQVEIQNLLRLARDVVQQIKLYFNLKFRMEPAGVYPNIDNDMLIRARTWHSVDMITGLGSLPQVPPPGILNMKVRQQKKEETIKTKYKTALENKALELEIYFDAFCKNSVVVELPIRLAPREGIDKTIQNE